MQPSSPNFWSKVSRAIRERPLYLWQYARGDFLFRRTGFFRSCFPGLLTADGRIQIGKNVRVQRVRCLRVDLPDAQIQVGDHSVIYEHARLEAFGSGKISLGRCNVIGDTKIVSRAGISLGDRVVTSWNVFIQDFDPHPVDPEARAVQIHNLCASFHPTDGSLTRLPGELKVDSLPASPIRIGDDVWIGAGAMILKGAKIGSGSIVAAGAVVLSGDWPARSVLAGNPARVVKTLSTDARN